MADTSLIFNIIARDKTASAFNNLKNRAESAGAMVAKALGGPALIPILAASSAGIVSMGVALASAGAAAGVFGAVTKSAMSDVTEEATKITDLQDKMELLAQKASLASSAEEAAKFTKQQAAAQGELNARMAALDPATRGAVQSQLQLKKTWGDFVNANKPAVFGIVQRGYGLLQQAIGKLQPLFDIGHRAASRLLATLQKSVDGGFIERLTTRAGPAMDSLTGIIINVSRALAGMFGKIGGSQGQGMLTWIEDITKKWADWATASDQNSGFNKFVTYAQANGPALVTMLGNLTTAAMNIYRAISPLAPVSMAIAGALAAIVAAIPPGMITTLVGGFIAFSAAMKVLAVVEGVFTAATWLMNTALFASPITWIVLGIIALIAVIVLVATKTRFFQTVWGGVWAFMKAVGAWFAGPFANFFVSLWNKVTASFVRAKGQLGSAINGVKGFFTGLWNHAKSIFNKVVSKASSVVSWFRAMPGKMSSALSRVFSGLWSGFKGILNRVIGAWNSLHFTVGGGSFMGVSIPSMNVGTSPLPYLNVGGVVQESGAAIIHKGETVTPRARVTPYRSTSDGSGGGATLTLKTDGSRASRLVLELLREAIRDRGGNVVKVLTPR